MAEFLEFVDKQNDGLGCWIWIGPIANGRGQYHLGGETHTAARYSFRLANGRPPTGVLRPSCGQVLCVNPQHLFDMRDPMQNFLYHAQTGAAEDCWPWKGGIQSKGYGTCRVKGKTVFAHRLSFELFVRKLDPTERVCHRCDNPLCVNPGHLFAGSDADNSADMVAKDRQARGERSTKARLSEGDVLEMRRLRAAGLTYADIGLRFGVSSTHAQGCVVGRFWKHLSALQQPINENRARAQRERQGQ